MTVTAVPDDAWPSLLTDMHSRACLAALDCVGVRNRGVILLECSSPRGMELRWALMAMGLDVFVGPVVPAVEVPPLLVMTSEGSKLPEVRMRLEVARRIHPTAPVCVVTGLLPYAPPPNDPADWPHDDARALLQAACIGFVCETEVRDAIAA